MTSIAEDILSVELRVERIEITVISQFNGRKSFRWEGRISAKVLPKKGNLKSTKCEQKDFQFASKIIEAVWGNKFSLIKSTIPVLPTLTIFLIGTRHLLCQINIK